MIDKLTNDLYEPLFFRLNNSFDKEKYQFLLKAEGSVNVYDEIEGQLRELIKSLNPAIKIKPEEYPGLIKEHLAGQSIEDYGVWVFYPWNRNLVHLLDEEEFVEVRTNRNRYKITREEQNLLKTKKIGIVGLSVGQSIALTLAMERTCGELRLADFDTAELSNLNRLRTGVHNLGQKKTIIAAREILEIDPFIKIKIFNEGLNKDNMDVFFTKDGKLDLFVEVCDGLDIKIESRFKARELKIPVVMDTNDRGMLDVERFDLEPERPILHGLAGDLDPNNIKNLSNEDKIPYILKMIGADTISTRLKASMLEVEQSINTWPQLASSVTLGGAITTDVSRRILLDQYHDSGRYYMDIDEIIKDKNLQENKRANVINPYNILTKTEIKNKIKIFFQSKDQSEYKLSNDQINKIIAAAIAAPSAGNNQPWKWVLSRNILFLFHDKYKSWSWGDYYEMGAHMSLGTALENVHLQSYELGLEDNIKLFPIKELPELIASINFKKLDTIKDPTKLSLAKHIYTRNTNRKLGIRQILPANFLNELQEIVDKKSTIKILFTDKNDDLDELGEIIAECDKIRLLVEQGHNEFFNEIRWDKTEAEDTKDGVEIASVDITQSEIAGFKVAKDWKAIELLANWNKGNAFKRLSRTSLKSASAMVLFTAPTLTHENLITTGRSVEKAWIFANQQGISVHPMLSPTFFFNRLIHGKETGIPENLIKTLYTLRERFIKVFNFNTRNQTEVFLMKLAIADNVKVVKSLRKNKDELFFEE